MKTFRTLAWTVAAVYSTIPAFWLVAHGGIARWRRTGLSAYRSLLLIWMAFIVIALSATNKSIHSDLVGSSRLRWLLAIIAWAGGGLIYARLPEFGLPRFTGKAELQAGPGELITSGMHAYVRHPIYLGHWLMLTGWTLAANSRALLCLWLLAVVSGALMLSVEERELTARFGEAYRIYQRRVPMILPRSAKLFRLPS
jgi:protein-S-isoprenylcysteine O-methyltransferase Ste14